MANQKYKWLALFKAILLQTFEPHEATYERFLLTLFLTRVRDTVYLGQFLFDSNKTFMSHMQIARHITFMQFFSYHNVRHLKLAQSRRGAEKSG